MFAIHEHEDTGVTVVELGKRLTLQNAEELLKAVEGVVQGVAPSIVVNASNLTTLDSTGIGALVTIKNRVHQANGRFALAGLRPELRRMLTLMNLHQVLEVFETEDLATRAMLTRRV
ncbi:MAG TPA: STAS domain-containing protein [Bacteroidota bacterium]|nr:STAS domain-containing protein [Bacteroidota bacterium]